MREHTVFEPGDRVIYYPSAPKYALVAVSLGNGLYLKLQPKVTGRVVPGLPKHMVEAYWVRPDGWPLGEEAKQVGFVANAWELESYPEDGPEYPGVVCDGLGRPVTSGEK